jgi:hypothetical protein
MKFTNDGVLKLENNPLITCILNLNAYNMLVGKSKGKRPRRRPRRRWEDNSKIDDVNTVMNLRIPFLD